MAKFIVFCLLWAFAVTVQAAAFPALTETSGEDAYGFHSEYIDRESGESIRLFVEGYSDLPTSMEVDSHYTPKKQVVSYEHGSHNSSILEDRDVCRLVTGCMGSCASTAGAFVAAKAVASWSKCSSLAGSMSGFLSANNYQEAKSIIANQVVSVAFQFVTTVPTYFINARLAKASSGSNSDACGQNSPAVFTQDATDAIYNFCIAIQTQEQSKVTTRYTSADAKTTSSTGPAGLEGLAKFFISQQKGTFAAVCSDFGVTWKRFFGL